MIPTLNPILFFLSALFGLQGVFIAEQMKLTVDFKTNIGIIEYVDLSIPYQIENEEKIAEYAIQKLQEINFSTEFHTSKTELSLISKEFKKKEGKLNLKITFSFENRKDILNLFRFNKTYYEERTSSHKICYYLLISEELISSNGSNKSIEGGTILEWGEDTEKIELNLKQNSNAEGFLGKTKSLAEYWKE